LSELFSKYKSVIKFILTFLIVYGVLTFGYKYYLDWSVGSKFYPDYLTNIVSHQSRVLLEFLGYDIKLVPHPNEPSMKLVINGKYLARIIEGCNGC